MGAIMCCLRGRGPGDDAPGCCCLPWPFLNNDRNNDNNNSNNHNSGAPARQRANTRVAPVQGRVPPAGSRQDDSMNTFRCPPRPLPYDDPQFRHQTERHPLVAGHDKASTQSQKSKLLEENNDADTRSTCADQKADGPSLKDQSGGKKIGGAQVCVPSDSEDDCPICLEEYDYENPKIVLQCNHNFHLSCIYEWMERSQSCAVCAKVMLFKEDQ